MSRPHRHFLNVWCDAVLASGLGSTTKLVLLVLRRHMNGSSPYIAFPSQETLADECSLSDTSVRTHAKAAERAGFLEVDWSRGRSVHVYRPALPNAEAPSGFNAEDGGSNPEAHAPNPEAPSDEGVEGVEGGARTREPVRAARAPRANGSPPRSSVAEILNLPDLSDEEHEANLERVREIRARWSA